MTLLALDTSTSTLHLAIKGDDFYEERMIFDSLQHSDAMLGQIKALLKDHNKTLKDLDLLFCTRGPGAFTSLRIGMATLKGFALALDIPLVTIPTLDVIANSVKFFPGAIIPVIDAKKKRYYLGFFNSELSVIKSLDGNAEDLISLVNKEPSVLVTGPDAKAFAEKLNALNPTSTVITDNAIVRNYCQSLIELGLKAYEENGADDIGQGPIYVRKSDAEEALLIRQKENK